MASIIRKCLLGRGMTDQGGKNNAQSDFMQYPMAVCDTHHPHRSIRTSCNAPGPTGRTNWASLPAMTVTGTGSPLSTATA